MIPLIGLDGSTLYFNPGLVVMLSAIPASLIATPPGTYVDCVDIDGQQGRIGVQGTPAAVAAALSGAPPVPPITTSGIYGPTLTPNAPTIAAFSADPWQWQRIEDIVSVRGTLIVTWPGYVAGVVTGQIVCSLPVPVVNPNLGLVGCLAAGDLATGLAYPGSVAQAVTDGVLGFSTFDGASQTAGFSFSYRLTF